MNFETLRLHLKRLIVTLMPWLAMRERHRLRRLVRAARRIAASADPFKHHGLVNDMCRLPLGLPGSAFRGLVPACYRDQASIAVQQSLRQYAIYANWLPQISLHFLQPDVPIALAAPPAWRKDLARQGLKFGGLGSRAVWLRLQILMFLRGLRTAANLLRAAPAGQQVPSRHIMIANLYPAWLPGPAAPDEPRYDYISWLRGTLPEQDRHMAILACVNGLKGGDAGPTVSLVPHPLPALGTLRDRLGFLCDVVGIGLVVVARGVTGGWWAPVLFREAILLAFFCRITNDRLAEIYVFNGWIPLRPLWSYDAERRGARVVSVVESTNIETWSFDSDRPMPNHAMHEGMTWPEMMILDDYVATALRRFGFPPEAITVTHDMDFADNDVPTAGLPDNAIVVFDVSPYRIASGAVIGDFHYYYTLQTAIRFVRDIVDIAARQNRPVIIKRKRQTSIIHIDAYARELDRISRLPSVHIVDSGIAARRLAERASVALSLPFTSAAIVAARTGKPSAYYDPLGRLGDHSRFSHGLPVLAGRAALENWLGDTCGDEASRDAVGGAAVDLHDRTHCSKTLGADG